MKTVFVSGCYDILHGGHVEFFTQARSLGDRLVVCVASPTVLLAHKYRNTSLPIDHKVNLLKSLAMVDEVVVGENMALGLDFQDHFRSIRPDLLAVTEDDRYQKEKRALCAEVGACYHVLPKTLNYEAVSTSTIIQWIRAPRQVPLRLDFGGGWLDVPKFARPGAHIVNCAISPLVSKYHWPYTIGGGLGGSAAYALLAGKDPVESELEAGVGWQDPAIIMETGLCVWKSGPKPRLEWKSTGEWLRGKLAVWFSGKAHEEETGRLVDRARDLDLVEQAGSEAREAVLSESLGKLAQAVQTSYKMQRNEGMKALPDFGQEAAKYAGSGFGGYAMLLFKNETGRNEFCRKEQDAHKVEPYWRAGLES